jgi:hypothetical protein
MIKVKGHEGLYRDPSTGAIINTQKPSKSNFTTSFSTALNDINNLKAELSEIKLLLREIIKNASTSN